MEALSVKRKEIHYIFRKYMFRQACPCVEINMYTAAFAGPQACVRGRRFLVPYMSKGKMTADWSSTYSGSEEEILCMGTAVPPPTSLNTGDVSSDRGASRWPCRQYTTAQRHALGNDCRQTQIGGQHGKDAYSAKSAGRTCGAVHRAAAYLNDLVVQVLFGQDAPLAVVPADPESNIENYVDGKMVPLEVRIFAGARIILTKNLNKPIGFVNGMGATVVTMDGGNVIVKRDQGARLAVHPWASEKHVVHYPLRLGYASTLHKVQSATLPHVTVWLDVCKMPAAAYVAWSRVEFDVNWRYVGNPGVHHFTPARLQ